MPSPMQPFAVNPANPQQLAMMQRLNAPPQPRPAIPILPQEKPSPLGIAAGASFAQRDAQEARARAAMLAGENDKQNTVIGARLDLARQGLANQQAEALQLEKERRQVVSDQERRTRDQMAREHAQQKEADIKEANEARALKNRNEARPNQRIQIAQDLYTYEWWNFGNEETYNSAYPNQTGRDILAEDFRLEYLRKGIVVTSAGKEIDLGTGGDIEIPYYNPDGSIDANKAPQVAKYPGPGANAQSAAAWRNAAYDILAKNQEMAKAVNAAVEKRLKERDEIYARRKQIADHMQTSDRTGGFGITPDFEGFHKLRKSRKGGGSTPPVTPIPVNNPGTPAPGTGTGTPLLPGTPAP